MPKLTLGIFQHPEHRIGDSGQAETRINDAQGFEHVLFTSSPPVAGL
jgi:hypothetical protein